MTARVRQMLLTLVSGSALAIAPMAFATVITPAASNADECADGTTTTAEGQCGDREAKPQGVTCKDGQIADEENGKCVPLLDGISKQLRALPPPPSLAGAGGGGGGGIGGLGFPNLGTINMPDLVLPSFGIDLVPDLSVNPDLGLGGIVGGAAPFAGAAPNALAQLPAPQMPPPPDLTKLPSPKLPEVNPLNPLGLPPPPDLTPGIPLI